MYVQYLAVVIGNAKCWFKLDRYDIGIISIIICVKKGLVLSLSLSPLRSIDESLSFESLHISFPINSTNEEQKSSQSKKDRTCTIANQHPGLLLKTIVNKVMHQKILAEDKLLSHTYGIKIGLKCKILSNRICKEYILHGVEIDQPPLLAQSITCPVTELYSSICHD